MAGLLLAIAIFFIGIGFNRAIAYAKGRRRIFRALLEDSAPAAGSALWLLMAFYKLPAWRRWLYLVLEFVVDLTTWPVPEVLEYRDRRRRRPPGWVPLFGDTRWGGSEEDLTPEYTSRRVGRRSVVASLAVVLLIVAAGAFVTEPEDEFQIKALTCLFVVGTIARQVQDLLSEKFVSTTARRSGLPVLHAYRDVLVAAAADLVTLVLASVLLLRWVPGEPLRFAWFREQTLAVVNGGHLVELRHALTESAAAVLVGVAACTFYASLLGPLKNAFGRRRTGDELMAAAESALRHGRPDRARRLLELGRPKKPSIAAEARVDGLLAMSDGRVLDAWTAAQTLVRQHRPKQLLDERRQQEDGLFLLQVWSRILKVAPKPTILELARDVPVRDSMMACLVAQHADALLPGASPGTTAVVLETVLDPRRWPLTFSVAHERDGDLTAAERLLPAADEVDGLDLLWRNQLARSRQTSDEPATRVVQYARDLLDDVAASDISTWPEWHRTVFSRAVSVPLVLAERVGLDDDLRRRLVDVRQAIAGEDAEHAEVQVLRNIMLAKGRKQTDPWPG